MSDEQAMREAANRLHHLSMRYSGAVVELAGGAKTGLLPQGYPGLREARDLIDLILFTRAEINGLTKMLIDAKVFDGAAFQQQVTKEYDWFCEKKAAFLGVGVNDAGLVFSKPAG